jgi:hypothetical protein
MTPGERSLWRAVYAASWHQSTGAPMGAVTDLDRARWCATQASRALEALRLFARIPAAPDFRAPAQAAEVLE